MLMLLSLFACSTETPADHGDHSGDHAAGDHKAGHEAKDGHAHDKDGEHDHGHDGKKGHAHDKDGEHGHDHAKDGDHEHGDMKGMAGMLPVPAGANVDFDGLADGAEVTSPVMVKMKVMEMTVMPAGELKEGTGHHHLIIDDKAPEAGTAVAKDDTHIHFGKGQTEAEVELKPGEHTLTLQFADGVHRSYGPQLSKTIKVTVK